MRIEQITRFIEKDLRNKIRREVRPGKKLPKITNERDLESSIYYRLRKKIGKAGNFKIATNFSVHGYRKKGTEDKSFAMPDIVILEWISSFERPRMKVAIELKIMEPEELMDKKKLQFKKIIDGKDFQSDFRKLNVLKRKNWIDYGYFIYLYHSPIVTERSMELLIKKAQSTTKIRFKPIAINKFQSKMSNKKLPTKSMRESRHKARQLYSSYPRKTDDPEKLWLRCPSCQKLEMTHSRRERKKCGLPDTLSDSSYAAAKAVRTRKRNAAAKKRKRSAAARKAARKRKRNKRKGR